MYAVQEGTGFQKVTVTFESQEEINEVVELLAHETRCFALYEALEPYATKESGGESDYSSITLEALDPDDSDNPYLY